MLYDNLFLKCSCCHVAVSVLCLFLEVPLVGLWSLGVAFPDHALFLSFLLYHQCSNYFLMVKINHIHVFLKIV